MRRAEAGFSIVDLLIIFALLLIVVGMFGPLIAKPRSKGQSPATATSAETVRPKR